MPNQPWVAILAIVVSACVALYVSHLHRKQMRQVELFRLNPEVGIIPPPGPVWTFMSTYGNLLLGVGLPVTSIGMEMLNSHPVSRWSVVIIALDVALVFVNVIGHAGFWFAQKLLKLVNTDAEFQERHISMSGQLGDQISKGFELQGQQLEHMRMINAMLDSLVVEVAECAGIPVANMRARVSVRADETLERLRAEGKTRSIAGPGGG